MSIFGISIAKLGRGLIFGSAALALAACEGLPNGGNPLAGLGLGGSKSAQVALLLPKGSEDAGLQALSVSAENAAQMALLGAAENVQLELKTYDTAGNAQQAALAAQQAIIDGADVIVGPLFAEAAVAAGAVAAQKNINVLALSNNTKVSGGNIFVLGHTFDNTAERLAMFAAQRGKRSAVVVHAQNAAGEQSRDALMAALTQAGISSTAQGYEFSQEGIVNAAPAIARQVRDTSADTLFLTADYASGLPILAQLLPENGIDPMVVQYAGLARWESQPSAFKIPGIQNGWFALPDPARATAFETRYEATYGTRPHPLAGVAFDGVAAVAAALASETKDPLGTEGLTQSRGFEGAFGPFRLMPNGQVMRALAVGSIQEGQVVILDNAPFGFAGAGF
ncbi:MAG: ABC transporter substrate-binding protein [Planktomarina sp.]